MAEDQKIHPVDVEAGPTGVARAASSPKPTAPLVPRGASRSDSFVSSAPSAPVGPYPIQRRTIPVAHTRPPKKHRGCFCRCLCWSLLFLLILIIAVVATAGILYLVFRPKLPKYSVDRLRVTAFSVDNSLTARATFELAVTARNPNKKIGIYYEDGSKLSVWYRETSLCSGSFPVFYQGHRNTTTVTVKLDGETQLGSDISSELQRQQQAGSVPLRFKGDVPVRVKLGGLKLWKVKARVRCDLSVNSLTAGNSMSIKTSNCKFRLRR